MTVVSMIHAKGVCSVYTLRRIVGTTFRQSETESEKLTALRHILEKATTMNSNFAMMNSAMKKTTKTKYAASLPAALYTISILFSDQQSSHNLHFLWSVDSDFEAFLCSDELVCRAALFPPCTRLVVADSFVRPCNILFETILFPMVFLSCLNHRMRMLQMNLCPSICSSVQ